MVYITWFTVFKAFRTVITLNTCIWKEEKSQFNNLNSQETREKKEPKANRRKDSIRSRNQRPKKEKRKTLEKIRGQNRALRNKSVNQQPCKLTILFFIYYFKLFNWRLITVYGGFWHTLTWINHGCTCVPPSWTPLHTPPTPSIWVVPEHWIWVPCTTHWICTGHLFYIW